MLRRSWARWGFERGVLTCFDAQNAVSFERLARALVHEVLHLPGQRARALLLRSEPQSGKTSFCEYLQQRRAALFAPERWDFHLLRASESDTWLCRARSLNQKDTLLVVDEAHKRFGDTNFGDFFKNDFVGRVVFVGTGVASVTLSPSTPFQMRQLYMDPAFAPVAELQQFAEHNLREALQQQCTPPPELWERIARSLVHICGARVGMTNFIGLELSIDPEVHTLLKAATAKEPNLQKLWAQIAPRFHAHVFRMFRKTRLMAGSNGNWDSEEVHMIAASIVEGVLRGGIFNASKSGHRRLLSSGGLRAVGHDGGDGPLTHIDEKVVCTPAAPYCYQELLLDQARRVERYRAVAVAANLMPCRVEPPKDGLDLVLRCLPHVNWRAVLCGEQVGNHSLRTEFTLADALPREVGAFQAAFADSVLRIFNARRQPTQKMAHIDLAYDIGGIACNVEMLLRTPTLREHIQRFEGRYGAYVKGGVVLCFVASEGDLDHLSNVPVPPVVPVLLAHFRHGAFDLQCRLHRRDRPTVDFTLELDGVAKKLKEDGGAEAAQRIVADDKVLTTWMLRELPERREQIDVWWQGPDGVLQCVGVPGARMHVQCLRQALPERLWDLEVHVPDRFGRYAKALKPSMELPLTSEDLPLVLKQRS